MAGPKTLISSTTIRAFFDTVEPPTLAILFDFADDLVRKVCNFSGSCASQHKEVDFDMLPMKNPAHPGELVRDNLDELGVSISDAAKGLGVTRQQLHKIIAGRSAISPEMAVRLEKAIGGTADGWMRMQINFDLAQVRERESTIKVKRFAPKVA
jgi:antitoxin HigA-1